MSKLFYIALKQCNCLLQSPILVYANFSPTAKPLMLQTNASAMEYT